MNELREMTRTFEAHSVSWIHSGFTTEKELVGRGDRHNKLLVETKYARPGLRQSTRGLARKNKVLAGPISDGPRTPCTLQSMTWRTNQDAGASAEGINP
jgi:hypothetical protein